MLGSPSDWIFGILSFLVVITVVVSLHELGHFWAAKLCRIKIDTFSIGFGPTLFSRIDRSGVEWRVAALPLGGYVKFAGDSNAASVPDQDDLEELREEIIAEEGSAALKDYFHFKPVWQRAFVTAAGPSMNTGHVGASPVPGSEMPMFAAFDSPGPFTTHPITASVSVSTPSYFAFHVGICSRM